MSSPDTVGGREARYLEFWTNMVEALRYRHPEWRDVRWPTAQRGYELPYYIDGVFLWLHRSRTRPEHPSGCSYLRQGDVQWRQACVVARAEVRSADEQAGGEWNQNAQPLFRVKVRWIGGEGIERFHKPFLVRCP
jgi:hypothetical protein